MVDPNEPITRDELDARLVTLAIKADLAEIKRDLKWMKWGMGVGLSILVVATSAAEIITAIKS